MLPFLDEFPAILSFVYLRNLALAIAFGENLNTQTKNM